MGREFVAETGDLRASALRELELILQSPEFRQSEQSKRLLRYLVQQTLDGNADQLRERAVGAALFGLEPGYDTNENPIVRVRANEIRKRLGKYYLHAEPPEMRLEVPPGAYRVEFRPAVVSPAPAVEAEVAAVPVASGSPIPWKIAVAVAGLLAVVAIAVVGFWMKPADPLLEFWGPALKSSSPVIICSGHPVVYGFTREFRGQPDHYKNLTDAMRLAPDQVVHGRDIVAIRNQYIGLGSAEAIAKIDAWLSRQQKDADIRFGNDLGFAELRKAPAVLIGAFQNRWTVEFTRGLRLVFETVNKIPAVKDVQTGKVWSLPQLQDDGRTNEDYILISRVLHSTSGEFVLAGAGITQYGGRTVAELLTNSALLSQTLAKAKPGWQNRNLQLLYHVQVIGEAAGPPELVMIHEW